MLTLLELFHGPTLAFKDIAMQLLGNFYEYYLKKTNKNINVIVATSGDTGAAAIDAIKGKKNMNIFVLHPHNKVSLVQRKLMSTVKEKNVFNIAIEGNFDDCQNLVKSMFADKEFSNSINMSGVNSINWARIIAQSVYYFYTYFQIKDDRPINFSVPTGILVMCMLVIYPKKWVYQSINLSLQQIRMIFYTEQFLGENMKQKQF